MGSNRFIVRMNVEFCHDKHQLAKVLQQVPSTAVWLPETYLSIEDFVNSGQHEGDRNAIFFFHSHLGISRDLSWAFLGFSPFFVAHVPEDNPLIHHSNSSGVSSQPETAW